MASDKLSDKLITLNYDLHTGSALGLFGKLLAFFAGIIAASLPVTGLMIWLKRGKSSKKI